MRNVLSRVLPESLLSRRLPEPPEEPATTQSVIEKILDIQVLAPARLFWDNLSALRPWWLVLIPWLLWEGWKTYQRERQLFLEVTAAQADEEAHPAT
ncbi:MAG: hypothetical protein GFH27_549283n330 [Chloroflexi bacterium AL-W]|nr:hypothetical protein [Chloroflexi bacterium AL-N1]NOK64548.1 hypothetical protein [Chloroflexi bacterium AL-N10]NOK75790.1 hypothetical protein [Chloroflexi bacterium AL-N5]NOK80451.1 hypothetical protein [Chloroflexi bacterium AL-W]NOK86965.1 hypothetical protein [Chloroflexi bacterium AL-N15]